MFLLKSSLRRSPIQTDRHMVCFRNKTGLIVRLGGEVHYLKHPGLLLAMAFFAAGNLVLGLLVSRFQIHLLLALACLMAGMAYGFFFYWLNRLMMKVK